jgi:hypothetical protein
VPKITVEFTIRRPRLRPSDARRWASCPGVTPSGPPDKAGTDAHAALEAALKRKK